MMPKPDKLYNYSRFFDKSFGCLGPPMSRFKPLNGGFWRAVECVFDVLADVFGNEPYLIPLALLDYWLLSQDLPKWVRVAVRVLKALVFAALAWHGINPLVNGLRALKELIALVELFGN